MFEFEEKNLRHEIVAHNPDIDVRFYLSEDPGSYVTPHWHGSIELVYLLEGSITAQIDGQTQVLKPDEFFLVNSRSVHAVKSGQNKALVLQLPQSFLIHFMPKDEWLRFRVDMQDEDEHITRIKSLLREMYRVYSGREAAYLPRFYSLLCEVLYILVRYFSFRLVPSEIKKQEKHLRFLQQITDYVERHHAEKFSVQAMAETFGYSPDYMERLFRRQMGLTLIEYLYTIRVARVRDELLATDLPVGQILERHGCTNYRVSMKAFRQHYGCTPNALRQAALKARKS